MESATRCVCADFFAPSVGRLVGLQACMSTCASPASSGVLERHLKKTTCCGERLDVSRKFRDNMHTSTSCLWVRATMQNTRKEGSSAALYTRMPTSYTRNAPHSPVRGRKHSRMPWKICQIPHRLL